MWRRKRFGICPYGVCAVRLGKHEDAEEDTDHPVDVKHDVVLVPGDHHDGGLQRQLQC